MKKKDPGRERRLASYPERQRRYVLRVEMCGGSASVGLSISAMLLLSPQNPQYQARISKDDGLDGEAHSDRGFFFFPLFPFQIGFHAERREENKTNVRSHLWFQMSAIADPIFFFSIFTSIFLKCGRALPLCHVMQKYSTKILPSRNFARNQLHAQSTANRSR